MKIINAFAFALLFAAGCSTYPEDQATYSTPTYGGTRVTSYSTTTGAYVPGTTQGAAATTQVLADTDRALVSTVRQALNNNPTVAPVSQAVYVSARNGTVTLTGTVLTEQDRQFIDNVVRNTSGVYSVNDQLQVPAQPTGAADTRVYSTAPVVANMPAPGSIFNLHVQGLDEPDRSVAQRILQELRTDTLLPTLLPLVNITVAEGRVTLDGNVQSEHQRRAIEAAIKRSTGVTSINNQLQVIPFPNR